MIMNRDGYFKVIEDTVVQIGPSERTGRYNRIYPIYFKENGKAICNTQRWYKYLS